MDQATQQVSETTSSKEDEGGIHRRLRDRNLLRKRKAEAEEKETNHVESQGKRSKASEKRSAARRGRPRKSETVPLMSVVEEAAVILEDPGSVLVLEDPVTIPDLTTSSQSPLSAVVSPPAQQPVQESLQSPVSGPTLASPDLVTPAPEMAPFQRLIQEAVSDPVLSQDSFLDPAPASAPQQEESLSTEPQNKEAFNQILIEDLGFTEEKIKVGPEERRPDEETRVVDLSETRLMTEQSKIYQLPSFSSTPLTEEYLPGN